MTEVSSTHPSPLTLSSRVIHSSCAEFDLVHVQWKVLDLLSSLFTLKESKETDTLIVLLILLDADLFTDKSSAKFGHVQPQVVYVSLNSHNKNTA